MDGSALICARQRRAVATDGQLVAEIWQEINVYYSGG
jgi:hypothetical protein